MKIAIPQWEHRVSPVLDVAGSVLIADVADRRLTGRNDLGLSHTEGHELVHMLHQLGVDVVICGAVSRQLELSLLAAGMEVIAHICGPVEEVLNAYLENGLQGNVYCMPGCCGKRRHNRDRRRIGGGGRNAAR
jgi:predicted Fe-Mo cluster-binding NifX family protein